MLVLLPNVGSNVHETFNNNQNPSSSDNPKSMGDGKESNNF